ncbi:AAA family ATPase [Shinella curvata]|uniref:AAA family ATPase n=1 Tax=Shinella curvata TaxID=1817964 RepID=A0ABT8XHP5_9HYPH|nr:AAA family ATPase [Shinella curvata]MCJ8053641.1 AAA family ATPase [Shinella curvata]MDO6122973.1 AAA family ATPase [Shinella curvata]
MRLDRLELVRYGKFTERSLDFGAARPGKPDFHLVYGPNEAGKSTLFSAYLDVLFGIERTSAYGFLHPYALMRVGGRFSIGTEHHEAYRLKRNQGSLVTIDDRPLPDTLFASVLGSMDRNAYRTMFSLDDESIERGGEDILKSEGELGAMLFSASSGLSDMVTSLTALKNQADEFYRPAGRRHGLSTLKAEIEALAAERKALDVAARDYGILVRERDAAAERHDTATAARAAARAALQQAERYLTALPTLARLRALRAELGGFDLGKAPPAAWRGLIGDLAREEAEIAARAARVLAERERCVAERAGFAQDDVVLAAEADLVTLSGSALEARFRTAALDLASRTIDRDRLVVTIAASMLAFGLPAQTDPTDILLPTGLADRLTSLLARRAALVERMATARRELSDAESAQETACEKAGVFAEIDAVGEDDMQSALSVALRAARAGDLPARRREARRLLALARQEAEAATARLTPWSGTAEALEGMNVPTASALEDLRRRHEAAAEALRRHREQVSVADREAASGKAMLAALEKATGAAGEEHAGHLRQLRDAAWQTHLGNLGRDTAAAFAARMQDDDRASDARLRNADRLSEIRLLERSVAEGAARLGILASETGRLHEIVAGIKAEIAALARICGLPDDITLQDLTTWLGRRAVVLEKAEVRARQEIETELVAVEARDISVRLVHFLANGVAEGATFEETLFLAEDTHEALKAERSRRVAAGEQLARAKADVEARRTAVEEVRAAEAAWQETWQQAIAGTWLETDAAPAEPEHIAALLPGLQTLAQNVERRREFDHRIAAMQRDREDYGSHARRLADTLSQPFDADDPLATVAAIGRRLAEAKSVRDRAQAIDDRLVGLDEEERALDERRDVLDARLGEIFAFLGCDSLASAEILLDAHRRRDDLHARIIDVGRDIVQQMRAGTLDEAEALLAAVDEAQLVAEKVDLAARLDELDRQVEEQHMARARAEEALAKVAGSDAAAALEERRRTALVDLAEKSRRYLATRAGILAAEQALRLYRERHRSAMMERASKTFRDITGGEYAGLSTMLEKEGEFLVANAASGASKLAKDLSKGTRFQLYLALRVAGYHEIAASREIVPFIADDIMETFDDGRALNALRVMGDMATGGQVIYLTHHQHLCDLAREACPDVTIHHL